MRGLSASCITRSALVSSPYVAPPQGRLVQASDGKPAWQTPDGRLLRKNGKGKVVDVPGITFVSLAPSDVRRAIRSRINSRGPDQKPSGWWLRVAAFVLDWLIVVALELAVDLFIVLFLLHHHSPLIENSGSSANIFSKNGHFSYGGLTAFDILVDFIAPFFPPAMYYGLFWCTKRGQTLGMRATGIAVRDAESGGKAGLAKGMLRYFTMAVIFCLVLVPYLTIATHPAISGAIPGVIFIMAVLAIILDFLWPLFNKKHQALHDKIAKTIVVMVRV